MSSHLFICLLCLPGQANAELEGLIDAHEATMGRVQALAAECDTYEIDAGKAPEHTYHEQAARDATRKRTRFEFPTTRLPNGSRRDLACGDIFEDAGGVRSLVNWDQRTRKEAAGSDGLRAEILPGGAKTHSWLRDPAELLLQRVRVGGDVWDIGDYLHSGTVVKVLPSVREKGRVLIPVSLRHPSFGKTAPGKGITSTLYFAPDCGGLVFKQVHDVPQGFGFTIPMRTESTVSDLQQATGGLLLPASIRHVMIGTAPSQPFRREHVQQIMNVQVNEEVPQSAFAFRFPEGIIVKDRTQPGAVLMHRWGRADAPAETWVEQPPTWMTAVATLWFGTSTQSLSLVSLLAAVVSAAAWYILRRQRRRQQLAAR